MKNSKNDKNANLRFVATDDTTSNGKLSARGKKSATKLGLKPRKA